MKAISAEKPRGGNNDANFLPTLNDASFTYKKGAYRSFHGSSSPNQLWQKFVDFITACFGFDTRTMALYRVLIGCVILLDSMDRLTDLRQHYTDEGALIRHTVLQKLDGPGYTSLHNAGGSWAFHFALSLLRMLFACMMIVGYYTQFATLLSWYWDYSIQLRNPLVLHNGDVYSRMIIMFLAFLPTGKVWSVDAYLARRKQLPSNRQKAPAENTYLGPANFGIATQLNFVYCFSVIHKMQRGWKVWFIEGSATFWALSSLPYYRTILADILLALPREALRWMTYGVLVWEAFGWFCLASPYHSKWLKTLGVVGFFALHAGFGACLKLEQFVWIGCTATTVFLPAALWDEWIPMLRKKFNSCAQYKLKIYYSAEMGWFATIVDSFFLIPDREFIPSDTVSLRVECDEKSVRAEGGLALMWLIYWSPVFWPFFFLIRSRSSQQLAFTLLEAAYGKRVLPVPALLSAFSKSTDSIETPNPTTASPSATSSFAPITSSPPKVRLPRSRTTHRAKAVMKWTPIFVCGAICVFLTIYGVWWNLNDVHIAPEMPERLRLLAWYFQLYQSWHMFSPPPQQTYYHVFALHLQDGRNVSLIPNGGFWNWEGSTLTWDPPLPLYPNYGNHRHWKYWENWNWHPSHDAIRADFGRWICREWNRRHVNGEHLVGHSDYLIFSAAPTRENPLPPRTRELLWDHIC